MRDCHQLRKYGHWSDDCAWMIQRLLGVPGEPLASDNSRASEVWGLCFAVAIGAGDYDKPMFARYLGIAEPTPIELAEAIAALPPPEEAYAKLIRLCDSEVEKLTRQRDRMLADLGGPEYERAITLAEFDDSEEAVLRRRYETACTSELHRSINQVHKNQKAAMAAARAGVGVGRRQVPAGPHPAGSAPERPPQVVEQDERMVGPCTMVGSIARVRGRPADRARPTCETKPPPGGRRGLSRRISRLHKGRTACIRGPIEAADRPEWPVGGGDREGFADGFHPSRSVLRPRTGKPRRKPGDRTRGIGCRNGRARVPSHPSGSLLQDFSRRVRFLTDYRIRTCAVDLGWAHGMRGGAGPAIGLASRCGAGPTGSHFGDGLRRFSRRRALEGESMKCSLWAIAWWSSGKRPRGRPPAGSCCPTRPRTSPRRARSSPSATAGSPRTASSAPFRSRSATSVLFTSYAGDEFKLDGDKKVLLMREDDILAVID